MRKTHRNVNLILFLCGENHARPSPEIWRAKPNVESDIQSFALDDSTEPGLRMVQLVVKTAHRAFYGGRVIILNERVGDSERRELVSVICLHEETARITED